MLPSRWAENPFFAETYLTSTYFFDKIYWRRLRERTFGPVTGRVLELGVGLGYSFPFYRPEQISLLVGIEPAERVMGYARRKAARLRLPIELVAARAEALPFPADYFDYVTCGVVFCTVPEVAKGLAEIRRVLKPGGQFRFFEHVGAERGPVRWVQQGLARPWKWAGAGCWLTRPTEQAIWQAGFDFAELEHLSLSPTPIRPHIVGAAVKNEAVLFRS